MKKLFNISLALFVFVSCSDFLAETPQDLFIPTRVNEYADLLRGETLCEGYHEDLEFVQLFTDDVMVICPTPGGMPWPLGIDELVFEAFKWPADYQMYSIVDNNYANRYKNIRVCNIVINAIPDMIGDPEEIALLAAQARTLRAYFYFNLINLYAKPYNEATAATDPGVILYLGGKTTNEVFERSSVQEVWDQIGEDLSIALGQFNQINKRIDNFQISKNATRFLAVRVALFQERWDDVIRLSDAYILERPMLFDLNQVPLFGMTRFNIINPVDNPEVVFNFGKSTFSSYRLQYFRGSTTARFAGRHYLLSQGVKGGLIDIHEGGDLRLSAFTNRIPPHFPGAKWYSTSVGRGYASAWRTPEVYLSLAEALVHRNQGSDIQDALALVNTLRIHRISRVTYVDMSYGDFQNDPQELIEYIWDERRREFSFEEAMRFWDLRRQGMPELTHIYFDAQGTTTNYVLPQGSPNYVLLIPKAETSFNDMIEQNLRVDIQPSY